MFETINGLPVHALVVHAVVVLTPLTAVALVAAALSGRFRHWFGWGLPALATVSLALAFVATQSGESLERRVESSALLSQHTELGDTLPWFLVVVTVLAFALWWFGHPTPAPAREGSARRRGARLLRVLAVVSVVAAVALTVQVVRIGDAGARATWGDLPAASSTGHSDG